MTISANKRRFPLAFLIGLSISTILVFPLLDTIKDFSDNRYNNTILLITLSGLFFWSAVIAIYLFLDFIKLAFNKNATLTINEKGINDNLSLFPFGVIGWADIRNIKTTTIRTTKVLVIEVTNPQSIIEGKGKLKQSFLKSALRKFGSPIVFSQTRINCDLCDLEKVLIEARLKFHSVTYNS